MASRSHSRPFVIPTAFALTLLLLTSIAVFPVHSDDEVDSDLYLTIDHFLDMERVGDPQFSPDGNQILYTRSWINKLEDKWESELWLMEADAARQRFLAKGSGARWSPDGTRIVYMAEGEPEGSQLYVRWMDDEGATSQITRLEQTPRDVRWAPDGNSLAFLMFVPSENKWTIDMPKAPKGAKWTEPPRIVERMHYRQDRKGFYRDGFLHLFMVSADGGTPRQLTSGDWNVGSRAFGLDFGAAIDWTPDGAEIVFDGLTEEDFDNRYMESHIYAVDVKTKGIRQITQDKGPWNSPRVSPDGKTIAYLGLPWVRQTYKTEDVYLIGIDGSDPRSITPELDRDPGPPYWAPNGGGVYFTVGDRGSRNIMFASKGGRVEAVTQGVHMLGLSSISDKGVAVGVLTSPQKPGDVVQVKLNKGDEIEQLTQVNDDVLYGLKLGDVEEIWYDSADGTPIQGWLVKPPTFDPSQQYPLILHIHGGPHGMYGVFFSYSFQNFAAHDYLVLYTNPRGSTGYGTEFGNAIDNAYPSVDYDDLMAGVDAVAARGYVDTQSMHVTGVSGGGVLSSWIIGHTDRFASAAVRAPVINWISFAGTTDITNWGFERFRPPFWEDPDLWLKHSPLMYVQNVKTPTLLMTGELDLRTPMGQSEEYYQALKQLGVETVLMRFNGEYHGTGRKPSNFMRTQLYLMSWFDKYGGGEEVDEDADEKEAVTVSQETDD